MKKFLALALASVMALGMVSCGAPATSTPDASGSASTPEVAAPLLMGTSADYAPFEFHVMLDGVDTVVGIDIALAKAIATDKETELEIVEMSFDNLFTLMAQGKCDMVLAALEENPDRLENASSSDPYYTDLPAMIVTTKEKLADFNSIEDFDGKIVGAQTATTKADIVTNDMAGASPKLMSSVVDLMSSLVYNKCDAVVLDGAVALQYVESNEDLVIVEAVPLGEALPFRVWVAKDDPKGLLPEINATIAKVLESGDMDTFIAEANALSDEAMG